MVGGERESALHSPYTCLEQPTDPVLNDVVAALNAHRPDV